MAARHQQKKQGLGRRARRRARSAQHTTVRAIRRARRQLVQLGRWGGPASLNAKRIVKQPQAFSSDYGYPDTRPQNGDGLRSTHSRGMRDHNRATKIRRRRRQQQQVALRSATAEAKRQQR